jgi:hypothetical protein
MNTEQLRLDLWGALTYQFDRGAALFYEPEPHRDFSPKPLLHSSAEKLWESVLTGGVNREAARYHFTACTYAAVRGVNRLDPIAGPPTRVLPGALDHLLEHYEKYGVGGLNLTRQVGCVVGVLTQSQRLLGLQPGDENEREVLLDVLVGSVAAELLYWDQSESKSLPHAASKAPVSA